jgi:predicted nucleotidyltransferase
MSVPADDPILKRFRAALDEMYGERAERVVLFGSRARGDAHRDSDYDVAVFLRDMADRAAEMNRLADLSTKIIGIVNLTGCGQRDAHREGRALMIMPL